MTEVFHVRPGTVQGTVAAPGSKSVTHRAFLLAAQAKGRLRVQHPLLSADTQATLSCLHALGARAAVGPDEVRFVPSPIFAPLEPLDCRNAGTTLRLLSSVAARLDRPVRLDGDASLRSRPNGPLLHALEQLGARCTSRDGRAPLEIEGPIKGGDVTLPAGTSSQFGSSLLLSLPFVRGDSVVTMEAPVASAPYLDVSVQTARAFGLYVEEREHPGRSFFITGHQRIGAGRFRVEGDWSAAAFPLVAAAVTGGKVTVTGVRRDSVQGDKRIVELLASFGVRVQQENDRVTAEGPVTDAPGTIDVQATPDLFPVLSVLAAVAPGTTRFVGGASLRVKESDRITAMADGLAAMGADVHEEPEGMRIQGGALKGRRLHARDDHRIHMALAVAGLAADGETVVDGKECASVSYPDFHDHMAALGGAS